MVVPDARARQDTRTASRGGGKKRWSTTIVLVLCSTTVGRADTETPEITEQVDSIRRRAGKDWDVRPLHVDPAGVWTPSPHS